MRFDASMESLINTGRSESFVDLNETDLALSRSVLNQGRDMFISYQGEYQKLLFYYHFINLFYIFLGHGYGGSKGMNDESISGATKQYGIGKFMKSSIYAILVLFFSEFTICC